jgi:hypothetical protein
MLEPLLLQLIGLPIATGLFYPYLRYIGVASSLVKRAFTLSFVLAVCSLVSMLLTSVTGLGWVAHLLGAVVLFFLISRRLITVKPVVHFLISLTVWVITSVLTTLLILLYYRA